MDRDFVDNVIFEIRSEDEDPVDVFNRYVDHAEIKPSFEDAKLILDVIESLLNMDRKILDYMKNLITERRRSGL